MKARLVVVRSFPYGIGRPGDLIGSARSKRKLNALMTRAQVLGYRNVRYIVDGAMFEKLPEKIVFKKVGVAIS